MFLILQHRNKVPPAASGVYCLWNKITNQIYVGSSQDLNKRINQHFSPRCQNPHLKSSIKKYGKESFSITWLETGTEFLEEEQRLLDYVFNNSIPTFNVAVKARGNPGGSIESQRLLSEAGGSNKRVPLFLISTETLVITQIDSSYEGERLGFGLGCHLSKFSKPNYLNRVKTCLVARSEAEAKLKLEAWLKIPGNNPIILTLPKSEPQSALYNLANVNHGNFSQMYRKILNPSSGEPWHSAMQSKADFNWYGTEIKAGDWFQCTK